MRSTRCIHRRERGRRTCRFCGIRASTFAKFHTKMAKRRHGRWYLFRRRWPQSRAYTFSVYEASVTLHQGIFPDAPQQWSGGGKPFLLESGKDRHRQSLGNRPGAWKGIQQQEPEGADFLHAGDGQRQRPGLASDLGRKRGGEQFFRAGGRRNGEFMQMVH